VASGYFVAFQPGQVNSWPKDNGQFTNTQVGDIRFPAPMAAPYVLLSFSDIPGPGPHDHHSFLRYKCRVLSCSKTGFQYEVTMIHSSAQYWKEKDQQLELSWLAISL
jgi:hypothetical protein